MSKRIKGALFSAGVITAVLVGVCLLTLLFLAGTALAFKFGLGVMLGAILAFIFIFAFILNLIIDPLEAYIEKLYARWVTNGTN